MTNAIGLTHPFVVPGVTVSSREAKLNLFLPWCTPCAAGRDYLETIPRVLGKSLLAVAEFHEGSHAALSEFKPHGEKKLYQEILVFERGPQGKVQILKKIPELQVHAVESRGEETNTFHVEETNLKVDIENEKPLDFMEELKIESPTEAEELSAVAEKKKKSRIVIGRKTAARQETDDAEALESLPNSPPAESKSGGTRALTKMEMLVDEKVQRFVELLWAASDEAQLDGVLKDAEKHIGAGRRAWRHALRTLLLSPAWQPQHHHQHPHQTLKSEAAEELIEADQGIATEAAREGTEGSGVLHHAPSVSSLLPNLTGDPAAEANTIIAQALEEGELEKARSILEVSIERGIRPSQYVVSQTLAALGRKQMIKAAEDLFELLIYSGYKTNRVLYNCMIAAYGEVGDFAKMESAVQRMKRMGVSPNIVTYNTLVRKYLKGEKMEEAMTMLNEMKAKGYIPNVRSYNTVLASLRDRGQVEQAEALLREMKREGCPPTVVTYNIVLTGYADAGRMDDVERLFNEIVESGFEPNNITIGTCMAAYRNVGNLAKVEEYYALLSKFHLTADVITLSILKSAYGKANRFVDQAKVQKQIDGLNETSHQRRYKRAVDSASDYASETSDA